jgi:outer membrane biosynthesis protein TonB
MDKKQARKELQTLRDSISKVLGESPSEDISEHIQEAQESAREGAKALKKSLIERIKDIPVVSQVSQLGAAGTVAVSTAAVTQVDIAKDRTEIFVAEVAQDVVEERFEVPMFIDNFVDFVSLNDWGQDVIAEKIQEAQDFVAEASEPIQTSSQSDASEDTKPESSGASDTVEEKSSDEKGEPKPESEEKTEEVKEEKTSTEKEEVKEEKSEETKEEATEDKKESEQKTPSEEIKEEVKEEVKQDISKVETPNMDEMNPIRPHDMVNPSPVR